MDDQFRTVLQRIREEEGNRILEQPDRLRLLLLREEAASPDDVDATVRLIETVGIAPVLGERTLSQAEIDEAAAQSGLSAREIADRLPEGGGRSADASLPPWAAAFGYRGASSGGDASGEREADASRRERNLELLGLVGQRRRAFLSGADAEAPAEAEPPAEARPPVAEEPPSPEAREEPAARSGGLAAGLADLLGAPAGAPLEEPSRGEEGGVAPEETEAVVPPAETAAPSGAPEEQEEPRGAPEAPAETAPPETPPEPAEEAPKPPKAEEAEEEPPSAEPGPEEAPQATEEPPAEPEEPEPAGGEPRPVSGEAEPRGEQHPGEGLESAEHEALTPPQEEKQRAAAPALAEWLHAWAGIRRRRILPIAMAVLAVAIAAAAAVGFWYYTHRASYLAESGVEHYHDGEYRRAIDKLDRATDKDPSLQEAFYLLGESYLMVGSPDRAVPAFRGSIRIASNDAMAYNGLGQALLQRGDLEAARNAFREALDRVPILREAMLGLGECYLRLGEPAEARDVLLNALDESGADPVLAERLGQAYLALEQPGKAERHFSRALSMEEGREQALLGLDRARAMKTRLARERRMRELVEAGRRALEAGNAEAAGRHFDEALALDPDSAAALRGRAESYLRMGRPAEAVVLYERLTERFPDDRELAGALAEARQRAERKRIERSAQGLAARGRKAADDGRYAEAREAFRASIEKEPTLPAYLGLIDTLRQLEEYRKAEALCDEAAERFPGGTAGERIRERRVAVQQARERAEERRLQARAERKAESGDYLEAVELYRRLAERNPGDVGTLRKLASLYQRLGNEEEAARVYARAGLQPPGEETARERPAPVTPEPRKDRAEDLLGQGKRLAEAGKLYEAYNRLERAAELEPDNLEVQRAYADACCDLAFYDRAEAAYERMLAQTPGDSRIRNNLGFAEARREAYAEAAERFRGILQSEPANGQAMANLGYALYRDGRYREAAQTFGDLVRTPKVVYPDGFRDLGPLYTPLRGAREAGLPRATLERIYRAFLPRITGPGSGESGSDAAGEALLETPEIGDRALELQALAEAAYVSPVGAAAYANGAVAIATAQAEEGTEEASAVLGVRPLEAFAHFALAHARLSAGDPQGARQAVLKGLQRQPKSSTGYTLLGYVAERRGETDLARESFHMALWLDPDNMEARRAARAKGL
ncbi:MAG: tetratricopeptide repeat protein [Synergistales bacterium]|nr:tetratricopeptide repeat protein [Synergistales bacterium]